MPCPKVLLAISLVLQATGCLGEAPDPSSAIGVRRVLAAPAATDGLSADQYGSIQAAIDALPSTGGTVVLSAKTYNISAPINLRSNVSLVGQGPSSVLKLANGVNKPLLASGSGTSKVRLANFKVDGNRTGQSANHFGLQLYYMTDSTLENLVITNCIGTAVKFHRASRNTVRNCDISNNGWSATWDVSGIDLNGYCYDNVIENNTCNNNNPYRDTSTGIGWDGNGVRIGQDSERNTVRGNTCNGNGRRGVKVQGANNTVSGNTLLDNIGPAVLLVGPLVQKNLIENNTIKGHWHVGIQVAQTEATMYNIIRGNTITGCLYGIETGYGASNNQFLDNTVDRTRRSGIFLRGTSDNLVQGNRVTNAGQDIGSYGIWIKPDGGRNPLRNLIKDNVATDNQATKTQLYGLVADSGADYTTVTGNDFRGNKSGGMRLSGTNNTISNNL